MNVFSDLDAYYLLNESTHVWHLDTIYARLAIPSSKKLEKPSSLARSEGFIKQKPNFLPLLHFFPLLPLGALSYEEYKKHHDYTHWQSRKIFAIPNACFSILRFIVHVVAYFFSVFPFVFNVFFYPLKKDRAKQDFPVVINIFMAGFDTMEFWVI